MREITGLTDMRAWSRGERSRGRRVGLVPTMGFFHEGHLRLVDRACELADLVAMSLFVNPLQFGPTEDFTRYPRDLGRDRALAEARGVDCLFVPEASAMYPGEPLVRLDPGTMAQSLEGAARPLHFSGVLTVVAKLFHVVEPDVAVFGRKDFQQAMLVRRMVADLDFPIAIEIAPTVRELDGLALSSRNSYLNPDQRRSALALSRSLREVEKAWRGGQADPTVLHRKAMATLTAPGVEPEYFALVDEELKPVTRVTQHTVAAVAARVGLTRLIDNVVLGDGLGADPTVRA
ncbi:MAG: pantoate--beta-alanine ligase [Gemmatimonadales bacterium]